MCLFTSSRFFRKELDERVLLVAGATRLRFDDETLEMHPGSFVKIAAHRRHLIEWTDPERTTIWLAIHY